MPFPSTGHGFLLAPAAGESLSDRCVRLEANLAASGQRRAYLVAQLRACADALLIASHDRRAELHSQYMATCEEES